MAFTHQTVLLDEAVALLAPREGKVVVDGTLGGGGHAERLLQAGATVIGLDKDPRALAAARERLSPFGDRFTAIQSDFRYLPRVLAERGEVDGVLVDLGVSSPQLDEAARGFSFMHDGPLDMRMSDEGETAAELLERWDEAEVAFALKEFGEEPFSRPIARSLKALLPKTTAQAVEAVKQAVPRKAWPDRIHVATRTFQALRIAVNGELDALSGLLDAVPKILKVGGRAVVISFHSLEDRMVKQRFRSLEGRCTCPPGFPVCVCGAKGSFTPLTRKAVQASESEENKNPRSRSARLRAVERVR